MRLICNKLKLMRTATLVAILFGLICASAGAAPTTSDFKAADHRSDEILTNLGKYSKVECDLKGYSTDGGSFKAYFRKSEPRVLLVNLVDSRFHNFTIYHFWNNRLYMVQHAHSKNYGCKTHTVWNRYYFTDGHLTHWLAPSKQSKDIKSSDAQEHERTLITDARKWLALASKAAEKR